MISNCEAELEEVYGHEHEHQTRRKLLNPSPEELSNCQKELEEVSGHEIEQQTIRQPLVPTLEARQSEPDSCRIELMMHLLRDSDSSLDT